MDIAAADKFVVEVPNHATFVKVCQIIGETIGNEFLFTYYPAASEIQLYQMDKARAAEPSEVQSEAGPKGRLCRKGRFFRKEEGLSGHSERGLEGGHPLDLQDGPGPRVRLHHHDGPEREAVEAEVSGRNQRRGEQHWHGQPLLRLSVHPVRGTVEELLQRRAPVEREEVADTAVRRFGQHERGLSLREPFEAGPVRRVHRSNVGSRALFEGGAL